MNYNCLDPHPNTKSLQKPKRVVLLFNRYIVGIKNWSHTVKKLYFLHSVKKSGIYYMGVWHHKMLSKKFSSEHYFWMIITVWTPIRIQKVFRNRTKQFCSSTDTYLALRIGLIPWKIVFSPLCSKKWYILYGSLVP